MTNTTRKAEDIQYSCIFTYGTNSGTGEVFHHRETFNTLFNVSSELQTMVREDFTIPEILLLVLSH